jgi:hypothetical protein
VPGRYLEYRGIRAARKCHITIVMRFLFYVLF